MNIYKAVIFDMDGTIVDTEKLWKEVNRTYLTRKSIPDYENILDRIKIQTHGLSSLNIANLLKEEAKISDPIDDILTEKRKIAEELYDKGISYINGFIEFHNKLKLMNIPNAIATNAEPYGLKRTDDILNLKKYFHQHMYNIADVKYKGKPLPDIYLYTAKKLNVDPKECIVIEDSVNGLQAAKAAGMYCIVINTGSIEENLFVSADLVVKEYNHIPIERLLQNRFSIKKGFQ